MRPAQEIARKGFACVACAAFASCLDPTEIVLEISTDVSCDDVAQNGVAIAIGAPGNDSNAVVTSTRNCADGGVGSLVVVPSNAGMGVGIRVTLGVDASVETCNAANQFAGCIVARRSLLYVPHEPLTLPIELQNVCLGKVCDPSSTCFDGTCVDAGVTCTNGSCSLPDASAPPAPSCTLPTIVESLADPVTPHIAKIPNAGYVITWVSKKQVLAATLDQVGLPTATPATTIFSNPPPFTPGPIGSNGQTFYTLIDAPPNIFLVSTGLDGGAASSSAAGVVPLEGVIAGDGGYLSFYGYEQAGNPPPMGDIVALSASPVLGTPLGSILIATDATSYGFARSGATYFASFAVGGSCYVQSCDSTFHCSPSILTESSCGVIRFAPSADPDSWAATVADNNSSASLIVGRTSTSAVTRTTLTMNPDHPNAFIPIATNDAFVGVARIGDALTIEPGGTVLDKTSYAAKGGTGAGFDVVADDPATSSQFTIVYWKRDASAGSTGNIYIMQCTE